MKTLQVSVKQNNIHQPTEAIDAYISDGEILVFYLPIYFFTILTN